MHFLGKCGKMYEIKQENLGSNAQKTFAKIVEMYKIMYNEVKIVDKI